MSVLVAVVALAALAVLGGLVGLRPGNEERRPCDVDPDADPTAGCGGCALSARCPSRGSPGRSSAGPGRPRPGA